MRLFGIERDGSFREYVTKPFQVYHEERVLESWLESNPDGIVEDGKLLIIGRQVSTNLGSVIDLLALDREGDVVVIELKRDRTPRETLAQSLEYASFVEDLTSAELQEVLAAYITDVNEVPGKKYYKQVTSYVAGLMLYDRLVVPVPPKGSKKEWERWEKEGWCPSDQEELLNNISENRLCKIEWDEYWQKEWSTRFNAAGEIA